MTGEADHQQQIRIGVFFGEHLIREWTATPEQAAAYDAVVRRQLPGLKLKISSVPPELDTEELPAPEWWLMASHVTTGRPAPAARPGPWADL